jgi:enoyl-CoA hydratase
MSFDNLLLERDGAVAVLSINRPKVLNALNTQTISELRAAVLELKGDAAVQAVILTGAGEKSFVAGADITELANVPAAQLKEYAERGQDVFDLIENLGKPVIAAINGFALGGGLELAMACHIRYASTDAKLGQPEIRGVVGPALLEAVDGGLANMPRRGKIRLANSQRDHIVHALDDLEKIANTRARNVANVVSDLNSHGETARRSGAWSK